MDIIEGNFAPEADKAQINHNVLIEQSILHLELIRSSYKKDVPVGAKVTDIQNTLIFLLERIIKP